jgi:hypothetical protein
VQACTSEKSQKVVAYASLIKSEKVMKSYEKVVKSVPFRIILVSRSLDQDVLSRDRVTFCPATNGHGYEKPFIFASSSTDEDSPIEEILDFPDADITPRLNDSHDFRVLEVFINKSSPILNKLI